MLHPKSIGTSSSLYEGFLWPQNKLSPLCGEGQVCSGINSLEVTLNQLWTILDKCFLGSLALREDIPVCTFCRFPIDNWIPATQINDLLFYYILRWILPLVRLISHSPTSASCYLLPKQPVEFKSALKVWFWGNLAQEQTMYKSINWFQKLYLKMYQLGFRMLASTV